SYRLHLRALFPAGTACARRTQASMDRQAFRAVPDAAVKEYHPMLHINLVGHSPKYALDLALTHSSSRIAPPRTPWTSVAIHLIVFVLWGLLFSRAFFLHGMAAWSIGMAYIAYDTMLLAFVAWKARSLLRPAPQESEHVVLKVPTLGVIVAAHNEVAALPVTL